MLGSIIRIFLGFVAACVAAGITMVLFVTTPVELASTPSNATMDVLTANGLLALAAATHSAVFAAPFALIAAAIGEWRGSRSWVYYALAGIVIAGLGFGAQYYSEGGAQTSIVNNYALIAFLTTGFVAGMVYWLVSGQFAVQDEVPTSPEIIKPQKPSSPPDASKAPAPRPVPTKT